MFSFQSTENDILVQNEPEFESNVPLHNLQLQILEKFIEFLPRLKNVGGIRAIPFLQVIANIKLNMITIVYKF